jgi:glycosyltransferase involved in cell wall biosynthesis
VKIGVVTTSYPRFEGDAAGSFVAGHAAYLRAKGHDVEIVGADHGVPAPDGIFYAGGAPDAIESGRASLGSLARFAAAMTREVRRRARGWDATVAHWWVPCGMAAAIAGAPRLLAIAHGGDVHVAMRARMLAPCAAMLIARRAKIVFVSRALRDAALADLRPTALARAVERASIVQAMGLDARAFAAIRATRAPEAGTIAVFARLVPIKGVEVAIDAMRFVRAPARLVIAGDGPLRRELARRAHDLPVDFRGALDAPARDELLRTAAVVVVPSVEIAGRTEGAPLVAREAIAAGVPVVASATGGLVDLPVALVPPGDPRALAAAIDRSIDAPPAPTSADAFDWAAVGAAIDAHWTR